MGLPLLLAVGAASIVFINNSFTRLKLLQTKYARATSVDSMWSEHNTSVGIYRLMVLIGQVHNNAQIFHSTW